MDRSQLKLVAANWKSNTDLKSGLDLFSVVLMAVEEMNPSSRIVLCPPFTALQSIAEAAEHSLIDVGAQNVSAYGEGAYTGEVTATMIRSVGATWSIVGHSERRTLFGETDKEVAEKLKNLVAAEVSPILCVGETEQERDNGSTLDVIERQLRSALEDDSVRAKLSGAIAYEPVWAIGTGRTPTTEQIEDVHRFINELLDSLASDVSHTISILYGGSVKAGNAREIFAIPFVDGGLIGGASLQGEDFAEIVKANN